MRIENINQENIKVMVPVELRNTKVRFIHIYENHFSDPTVEKAVGLTRDIFINKYLILRKEMKSRGVEFLEDSTLDKVKAVNIRSFLKSLYSIDVPDLTAVEIVKSYVALSGAFMLMPKSAKAVDVVVRNVEKNKDVALEKKIGMIIKAHTGREPNFIYKPEGPDKTYMPVFDLVLKACEEVNVIKVAPKQIKKDFNITKPEETDDTIRIPAGPACEVTATITISADEGIKALYCGEVKKVRTYIFDKAKGWTMDKAKAWVKEQAAKINKQLEEENLETFEYLTHHVEVEGDEEIVHHCHFYDHIGNLFEQAHLYIDKGKVYLDGKEIKEGHYHVVKGLEPKQEVAWSEEEATKAGVKPKGMMSGMTLKEKAKVW